MKPTKAQIEGLAATIDKIVAAYQNLDLACDAAIAVGAMASEGPLYDAIWRGFETTLDAFTGTVDPDGWVNWFIWANKCGAEGLTVQVGRRVFPVSTTRVLAKLILEGQVAP